ncbi:MAG TPA: carboxypeptidase regulatory-like domain-containing protein [Thermoanaerobaculia bacterium]
MRSRTLALAASLLCALPSLAAITGSVMTTDGQPLAGARVSIYALEGGEARRARLLSDNPEAVPLASAQTDAKGSFTLDSPKDPVVELRVFARGYEPSARRIERDEDTGATALTRSETRSGSVKSAGKPVANAVVSILYGSFEYVTKTDAQGRYEAPDARRMRAIAVVHPDFAIDEETFTSVMGAAPPPAKLQRTLTAGAKLTGRVVAADGTTPVANANVLVDGWPLAASGDDGAFTIARVPSRWSLVTAQKGALAAQRTFTKEPSLTLRLAKAATISGRITDAKTKLPVAGALVRLGMRRMGAGSDALQSAVTDAKGNFALTALPGAFQLTASHPAYELRQQDVSPSAGQSLSQELSLSQLARVSGTVLDESRRGIAAALIVAEDSGGDPMAMRFRGETASAASGPDGRFSMRVGADSDVRLRATRKGLPPARSEPLRLASGERKSGVVLTIPTGIAVTGRVTDREGNPLGGVAVTAAEAASGGGGPFRQRIIIDDPNEPQDEPVRSANDGTFAIKVKEGTHDFTFRREGFATRVVRGRSVTPSAENVLNATLDPGADVSGRVTRGGAPLEGVSIFGIGTEMVSGTTTSDGTFTISTSPGPLRLTFRKDDELVNEVRMLTAPARDVVVDVPAGVRVRGRVVDKSTHKPVTSFQAGISVSRSGGGMVMVAPPLLRSFTSDDGSFALEHVPTGAVNLVANAAGYTSARTTLMLEDGKDVDDVVLELDSGVRLTGRVTGPDGAPVEGASVRVAVSAMGGFASRGAAARATTDARGEYTLEALEPGEETIEFSHPRYVATRKNIDLKGKELRLDAQLGAGQRLSGTVVTESGAPVADAEISARSSSGSFRTARSDGNGAFTFESLDPARYHFESTKSGLVDGSVDDFDVSSGAPLRIVMHAGGTIYGHVSGLSADELANATVEVRGSGSDAMSPVDASGNYRIDGAPLGTVQVRASIGRGFGPGGRSSASQTVEVQPGSAQQVDLHFRADTTIRGRVTRNGQPLGGATVNFQPRSGAQASGNATTDEQGNYSVTGLEEGDYSVAVIDMQRFSPYTTRYRVSGSATFDIDYSASALRGRVIDAATGDPIANANVQLRNSGGGESSGPRIARGASTDAGGAFAIDFVAPGTYTVSASKEGYGNELSTVTIGESAPEAIELKLGRAAGVTLMVVDARDNHPLSPLVWVFDMSGNVVTDPRMSFGEGASGELRLSLAPGRYLATVSAFDYAPRTVSITSPSTQTVGLTPGGQIVVRSSSSDPARVRVLDATGNPYPRLAMRPTTFDLPPTPAAIPIPHVAPGTYTLQLLGDNDAVIATKTVTVAEGQTVEVNL